MIQVCSVCSTRWNVRERQRTWCPRCRGALLPPLAEAPRPDPLWRTPTGQQSSMASGVRRTMPRLPPGFRWIAVRPGAAPPRRPGQRSRGPTPRYAAIPRWGLLDRVDEVPVRFEAPPPVGPSAAAVRTAMFVSTLVLGVAALVFVVRYVLLVINRNTLLNSAVATGSVLLGVLVSLGAMVAVGISVILLVRWLIARRAAAFRHRGLPEPRSARSLWAGCLLPLVNLLWAPVYVIELALVEQNYARLRKPIMLWWGVWVLSSAVSIFAIATSGVSDAQGIANNTVMMVLGYLGAAMAVAAVARVFEGFERKPVERPAHRWMMVESEPAAGPAAEMAVELDGQKPAA
ncbi:DUF4328 domain-containing protein [Mycobacterium spongiae]|uniref:DUF4328 domain-containing protein n=1 Tax=Mycobacterium spongiae TaxID=886343 RepID=A0A975PZ30_9MYCO|nr:DUF4328 domain-containing protein [Mycobacterium spongiae]QUR69403.1 DUF4328 domain-containing protein [Mycobacterium spongiae]